jgi:thiamine monophosphate synthase
LSNAADVVEAGSDSVAVISALLAQPDSITEATQTLLQSLPPLRQT